jgi:hypothetical protein
LELQTQGTLICDQRAQNGTTESDGESRRILPLTRAAVDNNGFLASDLDGSHDAGFAFTGAQMISTESGGDDEEQQRSAGNPRCDTQGRAKTAQRQGDAQQED